MQIRSLYRNVSWRNPVINTVLHMLDPLDTVIRSQRGLEYLPSYSTRVRSNGIANQFGGDRFWSEGQNLIRLLMANTELVPDSDVMEIGCGCGRVAIQLCDYLEYGRYTGVDIDVISLEACRQNKLLMEKGFEFHLMDVRNGIYNPAGQLLDEEYIFPISNQRFDTIFLFSVFTHMLPSGLSNYAQEIGRMLRARGQVLFSTFLMDHGHDGTRVSFPYDRGFYRLLQESLPEKAVGYYLDFLDTTFLAAGMRRQNEPRLGQWRKATSGAVPYTEFSQDIVVYAKEGFESLRS